MTFFPFPAWLASRPDVSWGGKVLFAVLLRYTRKGTREAYPAIETLVGDMGSSRRTVERWLAELEQVGLVERVRTGRACTYRMAADPGPMPATSGASDAAVDTAKVGGTDMPLPSDQIRQQVAPLIRQQVAHHAPRSPSSVGVEVLVEGASAPPKDPRSSDRERIASLWRVGYCRRYESMLSIAPSPPAGEYMATLIDRALAQANPEAYVTAALDGFFGDAWAREHRYPIGNLAKQADRYAAARVTPPKARAKPRGDDPDRYAPTREWTPEPSPGLVSIGEAGAALLEGLGIRRPA